MRTFPFKRLCTLLVALGWAMLCNTARACAVCYGQSDSPMAHGMNWGILSLLAVIGCVLGGIASFFVYLGWRSSASGPAASGDSSTTEN